ncbi:MAG: ribosome maturation factor RimM [Chloroflexota bacterium]|nr:ribosome maturation factor RimM [Chloroflexota bacterium]
MNGENQSTARPTKPDHLIVGQVVGVFGIKGELKANILTEFPDRFRKLADIVLAPYSTTHPDRTPSGALDPATLNPRSAISMERVAAARPGFRAPTEPTSFPIQTTRVHQGQLLIKLRGIDNPEDAVALRGYWLMVPVEKARPLPQGSYYLYQIVGLSVYTTEGALIGTVEDVLTTASNDVYIVKGPGVTDPTGELLVPAVKTIVMQYDIDNGRLEIAPLEQWL